MEATSVARFNRASATPSSLRSAFSMRPTHDAQVMPPTSSVHVSLIAPPSRSTVLPAGSSRVPGVVSGEAVGVMASSQGAVRSDVLRLYASSVRPLSNRCAALQGRRSGTAASGGGEVADPLGAVGLELAADPGGVGLDEPEQRGATGVLPRQPDECQAVCGGDAAFVAGAAPLVGRAGRAPPGGVCTGPRRPHHPPPPRRRTRLAPQPAPPPPERPRPP